MSRRTQPSDPWLPLATSDAQVDPAADPLSGQRFRASPVLASTAPRGSSRITRPGGEEVGDSHAPTLPVRYPNLYGAGRSSRVLRDLLHPRIGAPDVPVAPRPPAALGEDTGAEASDGVDVVDPPGWILIIDDQVGVRMFIRRVLTREGYEVADAPNLEAAYPAYHDLPVRLLILDLILPDREMTTAFKQARRCFSDAEVIAISGGGRSGSASLLSIAERMGASATLAKPFRCEHLLETVGNLWGPRPRN